VNNVKYIEWEFDDIPEDAYKTAWAREVNNIIYGFMDPVSLARLGFLKSWGKAAVIAFAVVVTVSGKP
jgi:hypothetical protein